MTRLRRNAYAWLASTGEQYRQPVPGQPNYVGNQGARPSGGATSRGARDEADEDEDEDEEGEEGEEGEEDDAETEGTGKGKNVKALEDAAEEDKGRSRGGRRGREGEKERDEPKLQPFPLNPHFISQSIPSEALRYEVHRRVTQENKSVREVSVELGVEMRRVGAIVRLVELEKKMRREVSRALFLSFSARCGVYTPPLGDFGCEGEMMSKTSISLTDIPNHGGLSSQITTL